MNWQNKKTVPKITVTPKCFEKLIYSVRVIVFKIARCAKVIVTPDDNNNIVLTKGNPHTSKACILFGGQIPPIAIDGAKLT